MGRLIDCNNVYNSIQIASDNFGVAKRVVEDQMIMMLSKIETVEAIPKDQYEKRLKADMVAMLRFLWDEVEDLDMPICDYATSDCISKWQVHEIIQQTIDKLKEVETE